MFLRIVSVLLLACFFIIRPVHVLAGENGVVDFLPVFGKEMRENGMTPPKPFFISPMFYYMEDYNNITNAKGWIDNSKNSFYFPYFDTEAKALSVDMSDASINTTSYGVRAGFWLFPFLQIFGMYIHSDGYSKFHAKASPLPETLSNGYELNQRINFKADTGGIGFNAAYGFKLGPVYPFGSLNANYAWSSADLLDGIVSTVVFSGRLGTAIPLPKKNMDLSVWIGAMYKLTMTGTEVSGTYTVRIPGEYWDGGPDGTLAQNYGDKPLTSSYKATQRPVSPWNMVAGVGFNPCRYFGLMTEFGFIGKFTASASVIFNF